MKSDIYPVILAGGSGTRFWPQSRQNKPKQFLDMVSGRTLLQETLNRIKPLTKPSKIIIVTNARFKKDILRQIKPFRIPASNILLEPSGKNTAPAVLWAANLIARKDPQGVMAVLPSDHLILKSKAYLTRLREAVRLADKGFLVTLGIVPTRPDTGYGYLKTKSARFKDKSITRVEKFVEKPNEKKAREFIKRKNYLWNAGMFIWRADVIREEFKRYLPAMYKAMSKGVSHRTVYKFWSKLQSISIDYGILEKADNVAAVKAPNIGWSDLGSWESLFDILKKDKNKNVIKGDGLAVDCTETMIQASNKFVAGVGLDNMIVVDTEDALLVMNKNQSQAVREVVAYLKKKRRKEM